MSWFDNMAEGNSADGGGDWFDRIANVFGGVLSAKSQAQVMAAQANLTAQQVDREAARAQEIRTMQAASKIETRQMMLYIGAGLLLVALFLRQTKPA